MRALDDIRVVDLSRVLAGPFCGQLLADMGATVIKVEGPDGDENRRWLPVMPNGQSCNFASVNRGKRDIVLNLKTEAGREVLADLIKDADVLIHSFLSDTAERLGISYEAIRAANPRLIYCTISGYGADGPLRNKRGYDLMVQAFSGAMSTNGFEGGPPIRSGVSFIDMSTGLSAYAGIVTALRARDRNGHGTWVKASLLETAVSLLGYHAVSWMQAQVLPTPQGSGSWHLAPYQAFQTKDGYILVAAPNEGAWKRFCETLSRPEWIDDPRFLTNSDRVKHRDEMVALIEADLASDTAHGWAERFEAHSVACAPLQTIDQVMSHPQVLATGMVVEATDDSGEKLPLVGTPFKLTEGGGVAGTAAPRLGADTEAVLKELGYSPDQITAMRSAGAI